MYYSENSALKVDKIKYIEASLEIRKSRSPEIMLFLQYVYLDDKSLYLRNMGIMNVKTKQNARKVVKFIYHNQLIISLANSCFGSYTSSSITSPPPSSLMVLRQDSEDHQHGNITE